MLASIKKTATEVGVAVKHSVNEAFGKHVTKDTPEFKEMLLRTDETRKSFEHLVTIFNFAMPATNHGDRELISTMPQTSEGLFELRPADTLLKEIAEIDGLVLKYIKFRETYDNLFNSFDGMKRESNPEKYQEAEFKLNMAKKDYEDARLPIEQKCAHIDSSRDSVHQECLKLISNAILHKQSFWAIAANAPSFATGAAAPSSAGVGTNNAGPGFINSPEVRVNQ